MNVGCLCGGLSSREEVHSADDCLTFRAKREADEVVGCGAELLDCR